MESWRKELYLSHHGIKGQKWGQRNYQYEDGSLTPEGKRRYNVGDGRNNRQAMTTNKSSQKESTSSGKEKKKLSKGAKIAIGGAVVATAALATFAAVKIHDKKVQEKAVAAKKLIEKQEYHKKFVQDFIAQQKARGAKEIHISDFDNNYFYDYYGKGARPKF